MIGNGFLKVKLAKFLHRRRWATCHRYTSIFFSKFPSFFSFAYWTLRLMMKYCVKKLRLLLSEYYTARFGSIHALLKVGKHMPLCICFMYNSTFSYSSFLKEFVCVQVSIHPNLICRFLKCASLVLILTSIKKYWL